MLFVLTLLRLVVVLAVGLSGSVVAVRTVHGPLTRAEICSDGQTRIVTLDSNGNPVENEKCCDCGACVLTAAVLPDTPAPGGRPAALWVLEPIIPTPHAAAMRSHLRSEARGPPALMPAIGLSPLRLNGLDELAGRDLLVCSPAR